MAAARSRSWVMNSIPSPNSRRRSSRIAMTSACVVTSRAVVGSSASSRRGRVSSAAAIMTRCSMPPDIWCGYCRSLRSASSMPTWASTSAARRCACPAGTPRLARSASVMKSPMRRTGLMCALGSWKIIATWLRYWRSFAPASRPVSVPPNRIEPLTSAPRGNRRPIARAVMVLPDPDSPTRPSASPRRTISETSRSTGRFAPLVSSMTLRSVISSSGAPATAPGDWVAAAAAGSFIRGPPDRIRTAARPVR